MARYKPALPPVGRPGSHLDIGERRSVHVMFTGFERCRAVGACAFRVGCSICRIGERRGLTPGLVMATARRIMIVDDDAELRDALVEQLSLHEEFEAIAVETGAKGVQSAKAGQVDLVIMDVG